MEKFRKELEVLLNKYSMENGSNTPDFILAEYLNKCLQAFDLATVAREKWYGRESKLSDSIQVEVSDDDLQKIVDDLNYNNICARATLFPGMSIDEIPVLTLEEYKKSLQKFSEIFSKNKP